MLISWLISRLGHVLKQNNHSHQNKNPPAICKLIFWILIRKHSLRSPLGTILFFLFSHSVMSDSLRPHGLQHAGLPCPSPSPEACSNSCPLSQWCHPSISSLSPPYSFCLQSFPALGSFPMSRLFASVQFSSVQLLSRVWLFATPWIAAR